MKESALKKSPPLVGQVSALLRKELANNRFKEGQLPSERALARMLGVSRCTVRGALSDLETRGLVCRVHGRRTTVGPKALSSTAGRKTKTLGLFYSAQYVGKELGVERRFYGEILQGILAEANGKGYSVVVHRADSDRAEECISKAEELAVEGLLLLAITDEDLLKRFARLGLPSVLADHWVEEPVLDAVNPDAVEGSAQVVEYLASMGHRCIGRLNWCEWQISPEWFEGYRLGLARTGIPYREDWVEQDRSSADGGYRAMCRLLEKKAPLTAVFAHSDGMAAGAVKAALEHGLAVPEDLSVVGIGGSQSEATLGPALTSLTVDRQRLGEVSVKRLLKRIKNPSLRKRNHLLPMWLIKRDSCAPPRRLTTAAAAGDSHSPAAELETD